MTCWNFALVSSDIPGSGSVFSSSCFLTSSTGCSFFSNSNAFILAIAGFQLRCIIEVRHEKRKAEEEEHRRAEAEARAKEAEERRRQEAERIAAERAEREEALAEQQAQEERTSESGYNAPVPDKTADVQSEKPTEKPAEKEVLPEEKKYKATFYAIGTLQQLKDLQEYMKEHNIQFGKAGK